MSELVSVSAKIGKEGEAGYVAPMSADLDKPGTLKEAMEMYGEEIVLNYFWAQLVVSFQSFMRVQMKPDDDGKSLSKKKLQAKADDWKPGIKSRGRPLEERIAELTAKLTPEAKEKLLESLGK